MAKKKSKKTKNLYSLLALVFGIVAFCMMFLDAVTIPTQLSELLGTTPVFKGHEAVFGLTKDTILGEVVILNFNIVALVAFLLPVAGGVIAYLFKNKLFSLVAILCFVVGAIAMFAFPSIFVMGLEREVEAELVELCAGPILAGICSAIGAVSVCARSYLAK